MILSSATDHFGPLSETNNKYMKGVVLAGGLGSRLSPLTRITNKHLLPVYNKPMIYYPIEALVNAGIDDIMIVTGGNSAGDFLKLLRNGKDFGLKHLNYTYPYEDTAMKSISTEVGIARARSAMNITAPLSTATNRTGRPS